MSILFLTVAALVASYIGVGLIRRWAERHRVWDIPNERSSHVRPTPRGGGLSIVLVVLGGLLFYALLEADTSPSGVAAYLIGAAIIALVGWMDDVRSLTAGVRLLAQGAGALFVVYSLGDVRAVTLPLVGSVGLLWLGLPLTLLWIVGLTNAFNFMDGIDGLLGSQTALIGLGWAVLGWLNGEPFITAWGLLTAAGCLGFLAHNWPPARIFMGDVGSTFLGYTIAIISVMAVRQHPSLVSAALLLVWPLMFDTGFTILRRLFRGENVLAAHRTHLYQRLIVAGASHAEVDRLYWLLAAIGLGLAILQSFMQWVDAVWIFALPVLCFVLWRFVVYSEHRQRWPLDKATLAGLGER